MKLALITTSLAALTLSAWLWFQLREASDSFNSYSISQHSSQLTNAHGLEELLRSGKISDALAELQNRRDGTVLALNDVVSAQTAGSWRWSHDATSLTRADAAFRGEAAYRTTVGDSDGRLGSRAAAVLTSYR